MAWGRRRREVGSGVDWEKASPLPAYQGETPGCNQSKQWVEYAVRRAGEVAKGLAGVLVCVYVCPGLFCFAGCWKPVGGGASESQAGLGLLLLTGGGKGWASETRTRSRSRKPQNASKALP